MAFYYQSAPYRRGFFMYSSTDHASPIANAAPSVTISKAGASFVYAVGTTTAFSNGYYSIGLTTGDTDTIGSLAFHITGTGTDAAQFEDYVLAGVQVATFSATERAQIVSSVWATPTRTVALTDANRAEVVSSVWATPTRSLTDWTGIVNAVWATPSRTLTQGAYDQLTNQIWATASRTVTAGTVTTVSGIGTRAEIVSSVWATPTRTLTAWSDIVNEVWATPSRTVTAGTITTVTGNVNVGSQSVTDIASAVWASPSRTITGGVITTVSDKADYVLSASGSNATADALLARNVSGGSSAGRTVKQALHVLRNKVDLLGGVVYDTDDSSVSWQFTVASDSSTDRVITVDPA